MNTFLELYSQPKRRFALISGILDSLAREHLNFSNWLDILPLSRYW